MNIAGIILAAGGSSRMGRPKQLLAYRGGTLVLHAAATMLASRCRPVLVVVGCEARPVRARLADLDVTCVENLRWAMGVGTSISAGITHLQENCPEIDAAIVMPCDQPRVTAAILDALVEKYESGDHPLAVACGYGGTVGVPALFDHALFDKLRGIDPGQGAKTLLIEHRPAVVDCPDAAFDVDTPDDYSHIG